MAKDYGLSAQELNIIKIQASRRAEMRKEFIKQSTNPFKHTAEAGYVFDPAVQKFMSMNVGLYDHFKPNKRTSLFGICAIVIPMFTYGYIIWKDRTTREAQIRSGEIRYRERMFKFA